MGVTLYRKEPLSATFIDSRLLPVWRDGRAGLERVTWRGRKEAGHLGVGASAWHENGVTNWREQCSLMPPTRRTVRTRWLLALMV